MFLKKILIKILEILAEGILQKQKQYIIVVSGSLGKTSTKEAAWQVLRKNFNIRKNQGNYNNEIGIPLTILSDKILHRKSISEWLRILLFALPLLFLKSQNYPQMLILEIAAQKPGDLKYLMDILSRGRIRAFVLTAIQPCHLEFFGTMDAILKEKIVPIFYIPQDGFVIINKDSCNLEKIRKALQEEKKTMPSNLLTYGFSEKSSIQIKAKEPDINGLKFEFLYKNRSFPGELKEAISPFQILPLAGAFALGICFDIETSQILEGLENYRPLPGRFKKIKTKKGILIIDDTYNSSPEAARLALKALSAYGFAKRKIAVLGDMLELGKSSEKLHRAIGKLIPTLNIDHLLTFGKEAKFIHEEALKNGFPVEKAQWSDNIESIEKSLSNILNPGDIILVKGSRAMKMERIIQKLNS